MPRARVPNHDAMCFGTIVSRRRMDQGWTLEELSRRSGMNATYLGLLERGMNLPSLPTVLKLAEVFGVEPAELVREFDHARRQAPDGRKQ